MGGGGAGGSSCGVSVNFGDGITVGGGFCWQANTDNDKITAIISGGRVFMIFISSVLKIVNLFDLIGLI